MADWRQPLCAARDGRTTVEMIAAVFESHRQNGQRVAFPLTERGNPLARRPTTLPTPPRPLPPGTEKDSGPPQTLA